MPIEIIFLLLIVGTFVLVAALSGADSIQNREEGSTGIKPWTAPTYESNQTSTISPKRPDNNSLYPDLSAFPALSQRLEEVYLTYLIWDRKIIGKPHPLYEVALKYGSNWHISRIDETKQKIRAALKSNPTDKLGALWGTRHHAFAYALKELAFKEMLWGVKSDEFEEELHRLTFGVLSSQYVACKVDVRSFDAHQWELLFEKNVAFPDLEDFMTIPTSREWSCVEDIRTYISGVAPNDFLLNF